MSPNRLPHRTRRSRARAFAPLAAVLLALPLAACGSEGDADADASQDGASFEAVTIEHAFGSTEIDDKPERVVTWGWGSPDAAIALGVTPVAMEALTYGASEDGFMPWQEEAFEESGDDVPTTLTPGEAPPFEEILAAEPDLILANYSGITQADYDKLSKIADTVAYPDQPWSTPWRDVITTVGQALGEAEQAETLLSDIDAEVAAAAEAHPEFEGKTIAAVAIDPSAFYVYRGADPRVQFLEDLGFTLAPSVGALDTEEASFYYTISPEVVDQLTSDVLLSYVPNEEAATTIAEDPTYQVMSQFKEDRVATVVGEAVVSSVSPPTALSLTWGLDAFVEALVPAVEAAS
ncbi:periplasmic binding protein [Nocardioides szechwanensis]|uniref:Iron complex transport system substrate-binding protein n=1 Tax=Nocardioides szechwanensis TaxID=1005944 RepID=A0A1G9ULA8_9ACTN|nr:iron-siderophore ABC transporter substrate-binding protein [Nocardioides szechwanensis]GEP33219.1 periplasmic binding protein [Nocardioides szechwanensis]SDM60740.1 iron complex transport system substrate-binding protein [Nocardioides szechwanensis]